MTKNISKERKEDYAKAIKDIDIKTKTITNELQYLINIEMRNSEIEKGTIEYINDLIKTLLNVTLRLK